MLKFPPSAENKPTDLSYTNSCFSEHIASSIFRMLGICTQETLLGTFQISGKTKVVCACKDFTANGKILYDFCSIKTQSLILNMAVLGLNYQILWKVWKNSSLLIPIR